MPQDVQQTLKRMLLRAWSLCWDGIGVRFQGCNFYVLVFVVQIQEEVGVRVEGDDEVACQHDSHNDQFDQGRQA